MKSIASILLAVLGFAGASALPAQQTNTVPTPDGERLAQIVAVVGDSVVTNFGLRERILERLAANRVAEPPPGPELDRLTREVLDELIQELLLLQAAAADTTIRILDEEVNAGVDNAIDRLTRQMGGEAGLERALREQGRTLASYREWIATQQRRRLLISRYLSKVQALRKPPPVTDQEVRTVFEANKDQVGMRPPTISFEQVVLPVAPSDSALTTAKFLADSIYNLIRTKGEDFAALARRHSQDEASRELGGDLGWFRVGIMNREFEQVAFSGLLRPGDVTPPVRTPYGFHVIKLEKIRGPERQARHILFRPVVNDADIERARTQAEQVLGRVRAGESAVELARQLGDPEEQARVGPLPRDSLPEPYASALSQVTVGQVVGPLRLEAPGGLTKWAVVRVTQLEESRPARLEDYSQQIRQNLAQQKLVEEILQEIRRRTFVDIRLEAGSPSG